jgi:mutator protein MutT
MPSPSRHTHVLAAVVRRDGLYLLCQRPAHKRHGGLWEFPGGKLFDGETYAEAARRELGEELAIDVRATGIIRFSAQDPGSHFVIDFVDVEIDGEPQALEHDALAWVSAVDLRDYPMPPTDKAFAESLIAGGGE